MNCHTISKRITDPLFEFLNIFKRRRHKHVPLITPVPNHVAVIMDGNGRWANAKGLTRIAGHKQGVDSVKSLIRGCLNHEIKYLTIFAFSSENWNRPRGEVDALMELFSTALETQTKKLNENGIRLNLIGDLSKFSAKIQSQAELAQSETAVNDRLIFSVAVNYGGRWDITNACQKLAQKVASGELRAEDIDEQAVADQISTRGIPDPDLYIRTSGEYRISNFMLWQAAYAEFYFTDVLWPDFDESAFTDALLKYTNRDRRYGGAKDKVAESSVMNADISEARESDHDLDEQERKSA